MARPSVAHRAAFALLALFVVGCSGFSPLRARDQLGTGVAVAAKQLCTLQFVSGLDEERAREWYLAGLLRGADSAMRIETDRAGGSVTVSLLGLARARAVHRGGLGCTLVHDPSIEMPAIDGAATASAGMQLDRPHREAVFEASALDAALARAFQQDPDRPPANTLAVVVLHDGRLVGERYAEGITPETRLPGWSMTKSVTATLIGILVEQGRLRVHAPGAIREWRGSEDPRSGITLDHLLRMTSGLLLTEAGEAGDGLDPTSRVLYREADGARFAAMQPLVREVGTHFEYMSGNTVLAMRAAQEAIGGDVREAHAFIHENLFGPLQMQGAVLEADQAGTFLGSTHMVASARDWARFGQLYVDGGMAGDRRLITRDWIDYVTTLTQQSDPAARGDVFWEAGRSGYGAGFWLFSGTDPGDGRSALPADAFDANGFQGQYVHVIPSRQLVVVRLGATQHRDYDHDRLPHDVLAAMKATLPAVSSEGG
jgi:CubicO group peptidase (beta-lactamase class C family)